MKILLVNPPFTGMGGVEGHGGAAAPLGLGYLASYVLKFHPEYQFSFYDAELYRSNFNDIKAEIARIKPDVVAANMTTPSYEHSKKVMDAAKEVASSIVTIVGGAHPSAFPEVVKEPSIDACVSGEGEKPFLRFLETVEKGGSFDEIAGLSHTLNGKLFISNVRDYIKDLDTIPFPARHLMPIHLYGPPATKRVSSGRGANMISSRGCPFDCIYCESKVIWSQKVRFRSVKNVADEMEECYHKYGVREINFHDDILPMRRTHVLEFCKELQKRRLDIKWICMNRVNFCWPDVMEEMYKAGCRKIMFGFESGNNEILGNIRKKTTVDQAIEAVRICRKANLKVMGSFMIGNIGETEETIRETIDLAKKLDLDTAAFFVAIPYPGTEMFRQALELGYLSPDVSWKNYTCVGTVPPPLNLPGLSQERLRELQGQAIREFYLRPKIIFRTLLKMRSPESIKAILKGLGLFKNLTKRQNA